MLRKVYQLKAGSLSNMQLLEGQLPPPSDHEVQVAVKAIGLNFADVFTIWGLYGATPKGVFTPGLEYAGVVLNCGSKVSSFQVGDKVMGVTRFGAYTTHLNIDYRYLIPLPQGWTLEEGSAYLVQGLTAYYALFELGNLQHNQTVLIHSGAGGVGLLANRMAKTKNAFTIGSVGNESKVSFLNREGYDKVIVRSKTFETDLIESLDGQPLNLIMECIGGSIFKIGYQILAPQGRVVVYGAARYASPGNRPNYAKLIYKFLTRPKIDPQKMPEHNKSIMGFNLIYLYQQVDLMHKYLQEMKALNLAAPHVGHQFPFKDLPEAIRLFQTGKTIGKIVVTISE